ncbi:hypothetical protein GQ457_08G024670 [Hibiscus cannabinus]
MEAGLERKLLHHMVIYRERTKTLHKRNVNASLASGTAREMVTHAWLATYKVCWETGCFGSEILAEIDRAIQDGVDVLSLSLGGGSGPYYRETIAIGAFTTMKKDIFVSCSAGNNGLTMTSHTNMAPWIMTVKWVLEGRRRG